MPKKKVEQEEAREGCYGTYSDDDDNCNDDCPDYDDCIERTEEIESDLADLDDDDSGEDETEEVDDGVEDDLEEQEEDFDPSTVDLSDPATRIDALADLELPELLAVAKFHKIKITGDARKDDSEIMILIDDHFDNLPDDKEEELEEEEEEPKPKPRKRKKKPEPEQEEELEDEPPEIEEEEEKPKPRRRRKKKVDPEPEIQEDFVDEEKDPSDEAMIAASDVITETIEVLLDRSERYLVRYGDIDHLKGVRDKLNGIVAARSKSMGLADDQSEEPEEVQEEEEEALEPEYPDIPEYFAEIAASVKAKVYQKGDKVSIKKGPTVLAMLVLYKEKWQVLFSQGKLDKLPGTKPYKPYKNYPAIPADHAKAGKLLSFHVKTRIRGMKKRKTIVR